jgi:uncharacterized protein (TIRG00374 family)
MKRWQFWLGVAVSAIFLFFALRGLKLDDFWSAVKSAQYWWLLPGLAVYFIAVWVRAWRWHYLLKPIKSVSVRRMFPITCIGYMGNNIYPARAGEVLRAVILKRKEGVSISASLATIIVERIFDAVVMLGFVFLNLPELARVASADSGFVGNIQQFALIGTGLFIGALVIFILAAMFPRVTIRVGQWFIDHLLPGGVREKATGIMHKFLDGLASLRSPVNVLMVFLTSALIWILETVKYWFVMATTIPAAPGYIGTWEAVTKAVLVAYKVPGAEALGYAVVLHVALWLPITLLGAYYMAREGIKWSDALRKDTTGPDEVKPPAQDKE